MAVGMKGVKTRKMGWELLLCVLFFTHWKLACEGVFLFHSKLA